MGFETLATGVIFLLTYAAIVSEKIHRTVTALVGGMLMIILGVVSQEEAFHAIDLNVIFLLVGMMVIANVMAETGVFQWMAIRAVQLGKGRPGRVMVILALVTAVSSSVLDNVTVIVLIAPVAIFVAGSLGVSPIPFLITSVMASNIGGAATLVGDPPNILIGSAADIDFFEFLVNMAPPVLISLVCYVPIMLMQFRKQLDIDPEKIEGLLHLSTEGVITNPDLLRRSLIVLGLILVAFLLETVTHLETATIAMAGATLLLLITGFNPARALEKVEWSTLFFFVGLFILVESVVEVGWIERAAGGLLRLTEGNVRITTHLLLWVSALASGIVDNIPYTAAMIPLIESLRSSMNIAPLWYALALGADFGGNLTLVGASANIVAANLVMHSGHRISFREFFLYGISTVFVTLVVATLWLEWAYLS
ncbi:MAG TPA: ArsB/NhaD family transporter [Anaerolineales bacterium]|nr:ArsB/NhaD family transporter [Anaerolineales bacterium]